MHWHRRSQPTLVLTRTTRDGRRAYASESSAPLSLESLARTGHLACQENSDGFHPLPGDCGRLHTVILIACSPSSKDLRLVSLLPKTPASTRRHAVNGLDLHVTTWRGNGPPLLLVHGISG